MTARGLFLNAPGTINANVQIPNTFDGGYHPHLVDFYVPQTFTRAMVLLHGGGGSKENFAANLAILHTPVVDVNNVRWAMLTNREVIAVFPQGQHCSGIVGPFNPYGVNTVSTTNPNGVATWSNHVMWSQADDVKFLLDLSTYIQSMYGITGISLCGHSNGGMMAERMWIDNGAGGGIGYTHYCVSSGPASDYYKTHVYSPIAFGVKPFFSQIGGLDAILDVVDGPNGSGDHFYDATWAQNPAQKGYADVAYNGVTIGQTNWIGEFAQLQNRASVNAEGPILKSAGVVTNVKIGTQTTWTTPSGYFVLQLLSSAGHEVVSHEQCTGRRLFRDWFDFIKNT